MNERLKKIRTTLGLTLDKFGEKVGLRKSSLSQIEHGVNNVTNQLVVAVCREFNVNERWLRTGEGEMFLPTNRNNDIANLTMQLLNEESGSFKNRFISMLSNLTEQEWEFLEKKAKELCEIKDE